ncbi:MAG: sodium:solute symporter family protein [Pirellulaceae bacterium]|nr:sodium:solute symporter family protein [Pirellulaceae bacterium]
MPLTALWIIVAYLGLLIVIGIASRYFSRGTSTDFFVISRNVGPVLLLLSIFGTTMTGFALVGSTGKAYTTGIAVYGLMASWSGLVHSAVFFLIGVPLWAIGKRFGYVTQCQYFRERFDSPLLAYTLFPVLVLLVIPYLLVGVISAGNFLQGTTAGMLPELFPMPELELADGSRSPHPLNGSVPAAWGGLIICLVVLFYVFAGGLRGAVWANALQTVIFVTSGAVAFYLISQRLGGMTEAARMVADSETAHRRLVREGAVGHLEFLTYCLVPLSVAMFPHIFQHWLTARSAKSFRLTVVAHPVFILLLWLPCVMIGIWAAGYLGPGQNPNLILGTMVRELVGSQVLTGLLAAGVLAAIMSSLDSQFVCLGTMFTSDIVVPLSNKKFSDQQKILIARSFILLVVALAYGLSVWFKDRKEVFDLGVWCFSGFSGLFPVAAAAIYWRRATAAGAISAVVATAATWILLFTRNVAIATPGSGESLVGGMMPVTYIFAASASSLVIASLLTQPPQPAVVDRFFVDRA